VVACYLVRRTARWTKLLLPPLLVITAFRSTIADWHDVPTNSMHPAVMVGDRIVVNKVAYELRVPFCGWRLARWANPAHGDVVAFVSPDGVRVFKRVVGLPGDQIELRHSELYVNGVSAAYEPADPDEALRMGEDQAFVKEHMSGKTRTVVNCTTKQRSSFGPVVVPDGHYFMMGDNRDNSRDSRSYGFVKESSIFGRVTSVALSMDTEQKLSPRWNRFLRMLD
jgi:signal peptidase I